MHARSCCHMSTGTHQHLQDFAGASAASYQMLHRLLDDHFDVQTPGVR